MTEIPKRQYTPGEVSKMLEIDNETLKKWVSEFNIQTERTSGGHRRYSAKNIEELQAIKEKIRIQGWSWKQVQQWRNGELDVFVTHQEKSDIEKKMDLLLKQREEDQEVMKKMAEQIFAMQNYIDQKLEVRDKALIQSLTQTLDNKKKRKGFLNWLKK